jgi:GNAT superfamily N-acetyltransferase
MSLKIKEVGKKYHHLILELDRKLFQAGEPRPTFDDTYCWIVFSDGKPVGYGILSHSVVSAENGYLCRCGVLKEEQGKGLQKRLIRVRERKARKLGMKTLVTDTVPFNIASSNNLIACGYKTYTPEKPWSLKNAIYWKKNI